MNKIWISIGKSRKELKWKNIEIEWPKLVNKLQKPVITDETFGEYMKLTPAKQDAIKDVGGFVGGIIDGGRRKASAITNRYLITLDLDSAGTYFFDDFCMMYDCAACVYSTHKHTEAKPRLRLVMPLSREVLADEYEAIARKIAETLGMAQFDPTTFQPERLMYWPSVSRNAKFYFDQQAGYWLDPDAILDSYSDWRDTSQWCVHDSVGEVITRSIKKQGDPLEKPGAIGCFCRVYSITDVLEKFLPDEYAPTEQADRYTYLHGSTSGGLVIYDDRFAFSHHSTDPSSGKLCNAFDLVRLHKYNDLDINAEADTPVNKLPSYVAMVEFAVSLEDVKTELIQHQLEGAANDFAGGLDDPVDDMLWLKKLDVDKKGNVLNTISNCIKILENDARIKDALAFNDFEKRIVLKRKLPWRKVYKEGDIIADADDSDYRNFFEKVYNITSIKKIEDAIVIAARRKTFHPVKEYLQSLTWDKRDRIDRLLIDYFGAENSVYVKEVTRKTIVAAVSRIYEPGIKFDNVLTLVGNEGIGKSFFISALGKEWYSDTFGSLQNKDAMESIQGVWIMELAEMAELKRAEIETVKLFISKQKDRFRVAYGHRVDEFLRQSIFIATTNEEDFLRGAGGNRRFWPVKLGNREPMMNVFDISKKDIDQIWAEACYLYTAGEDLFLTPEVENIAREVQREHTEHDEREGAILQYLNLLLPENWEEMDLYTRISFIAGDELASEGTEERMRVSVPEIWCEKMRNQLKDMSYHNTKYIRDTMRKLKGEWIPKVVKTKQYGLQRGWLKKNIYK